MFFTITKLQMKIVLVNHKAQDQRDLKCYIKIPESSMTQHLLMPLVIADRNYFNGYYVGGLVNHRHKSED